MSQQTERVWLITGCSTGFGRELAKVVIARGERIAVTSRNAEQVADLAAGKESQVLPLALDVTQADSITQAVARVKDTFGRLDVLINNAGYGYLTSVEEGVESEIRAQFDANVFGLFALTREVLPIMRAQRSGYIINLSSVAGLVGFPGGGYYAASKHAVEGWSSSLAFETEPLGIKVTCIEPGPFRTDWAGRSLQRTTTNIEDYADTVAARMENTMKRSGQQAGDPARAAQTIVGLADNPKPPHHLVLGKFGVDIVTERMQQTLDEMEQWRQVGLDTDFPESK